jgi:hypothetical protein
MIGSIINVNDISNFYDIFKKDLFFYLFGNAQ